VVIPEHWPGAERSDHRLTGSNGELARDEVEFRLADGASVIVPDADLRLIYNALWDLSDRRGAISTAVLLIDEAQKRSQYRHPVELNPKQSNVLKTAIDSSARTTE
jgi:hypothetical protein